MFVGGDEVRAPRIDRRLNYPLPSAGQESTEKQPPPRHGCRDPRPECDQRQPWPDGRVTPEPVGYSPQDCLHDHLTHRKGGEDPPRVGEPTPACVPGKQCEVHAPRRRSGAIAMASTCAEVDDKAMASPESTRNPMSAGTVRAAQNPAAERV